MNNSGFYKKIIAIITAGISILIGLLYLLLISIMDTRGQMLPPPPEAFGAVVAEYIDSSLMVQPLYKLLPQGNSLSCFHDD